ncbi:hypothetical protein BC834DRAFT_974385 [Gloeopeniophorella convolvens]|nr:hypothetical protein BC834DRAFT_974385 [Gloeopeniophorella convolvens]
MKLKSIVHEIQIQNQVIFFDLPIEAFGTKSGGKCRVLSRPETLHASLLAQFTDDVLQRPLALIEVKDLEAQYASNYLGDPPAHWQ